jgi:serine protease
VALAAGVAAGRGGAGTNAAAPVVLSLSLRQKGICCAAALLLCSVAATAAVNARTPPPAAAALEAGSVNGLIVQLRDAPSHVELARERAQARARGAAAPASERDSARWQRLVADLQGDAALRREVPAVGGAARRDPVGARAQLLHFAQPLTRTQAEQVAARLALRADVQWAEPNARERRLATANGPPSDPYFGGPTGQWWLQAVQGSNASAIEGRLRGVPGYLSGWTNGTTGAAAAVVAVLDTGITPHPELAGRMLPGYDFVSDWDRVTQRGYANDGDGRDADPSDPGDWVSDADRRSDPARYSSCVVENSSWHGTVIAGMVASLTNNGVGGAAMNWNGRVLPVRVAGKCGADLADIIDGIYWAAGLPVAGVPDNPNPARIINISFGGSAACGGAYQQAIDDVRAAPGGGAVVVAAAGNEWGAPTRPASCLHAVGVAALNRDGFKTNYSSFGAAIALATVGGDDNDGAWGPTMADSGVLTIGNDGLTAPTASGYYYHFGTSFSAPIVAGAVSLMLSLNPTLTGDQIVTGLKVSSRPHVSSTVPGFGTCSDANPGRCLCTTTTCGAGILDVTQALAYAASVAQGGVYTPPNWPPVSLDNIPELIAAAATGPDRPPNSQPPPPSGGGGGALSWAWLLALVLAAWTLQRGRLSAPRPPRPRTARTPHQVPER